MDNGVHFISGLPRAGSTLLAALLRQNPRFSAGMTSPVNSLFNAMLRETSQKNEGAVFIDGAGRRRLLTALFDAYYADVHVKKLVFDTSRGWTARLPALADLFPKAKVICCVRNVSWIMDSIERLVRRNAFELSGIFGFDPSGTVYSRLDGLGSPAGMVGFAYNALREAVFGEHADRLLLIRYKSLTENPLETIGAVYRFIGEPLFPHDPGHLEPCPDAAEFDARLGTPGLHAVGSAVRLCARSTVLPPDLFAKYERDAFWEDPARLPKAVTLV